VFLITSPASKDLPAKVVIRSMASLDRLAPNARCIMPYNSSVAKLALTGSVISTGIMEFVGSLKNTNANLTGIL
jgi:hypothetical protein